MRGRGEVHEPSELRLSEVKIIPTTIAFLGVTLAMNLVICIWPHTTGL